MDCLQDRKTKPIDQSRVSGQTRLGRVRISCKRSRRCHGGPRRRGRKLRTCRYRQLFGGCWPSCDQASTGEAAISLCNSGTSIDIVITDINLGGSVSGWDVAECFRTVLPNLPVLYTSGEAIDRSRCVSGSAVLAKPYQNTDVLKECQRLTEFWHSR